MLIVRKYVKEFVIEVILILEVIVHKTDDGYTAEIPSLKGCESWAHDEETVLDKIIELAAYYLKMEIGKPGEMKLDRARRSKNKTIYKLVLNKNVQ